MSQTLSEEIAAALRGLADELERDVKKEPIADALEYWADRLRNG